MVMIQSIHHTCITVSDLERSIQFYRDLLGLELVMTEESERSGDDRGSWDPVGPWGFAGGRVYSTASMVLCLEVYFRYAKVLGAR